MRYAAVVHTWCLMSNHYHLLLETPSGNLAQTMRHINGAYTTYFNVKWKRAGHLFREDTRQSWSRLTPMLWSLPATCISILCERGWWPNRSKTRGRALEAPWA